MGYKGVPSRACLPCRTRKVKCDETRPACNRCVNAKRECSGYRDTVDILFKNETDTVKRKIERRSERNTPPRAGRAYGESQNAVVRSRTGTPPSVTIPAGLGVAVEDQAVAFFFKNYIVPPSYTPERKSYMTILGDLWPQMSTTSGLYHAVTATSLAALAKDPARHDASNQAALAYGQALRKVAAAMDDPLQAKTNETLLTCLVLALYELIAASSRSILGYSKHIDGAASLVRLRGNAQFQDPAGRNIYRAVRNNVLATHIQGANPLVDFPIEICDDVADADERIASRLFNIAMDIPSLRRQANNLLDEYSNSSDPTSVVEFHTRVQAADATLDTWYHDLPKKWHPRTIASYTPSPPAEPNPNTDLYPGPLHAYDSMHYARILNNYRSYRLYLQAILGRIAIWRTGPSYLTDPAYIAAYRNIRAIVDDVCASVPYHLGYTIGKTPSAREGPELGGGGPLMLIWPLFVAGSVECIPDVQRKWLHGKLMFLARQFGLSQAQALSAAPPAMIAGLHVFRDDSEDTTGDLTV